MTDESNKLICPECLKNGLTSIVYVGMSSRTAMYFTPFYDENGIYHHNDQNKTTTHYTCSNGHEFKIES